MICVDGHAVAHTELFDNAVLPGEDLQIIHGQRAQCSQHQQHNYKGANTDAT